MYPVNNITRGIEELDIKYGSYVPQKFRSPPYGKWWWWWKPEDSNIGYYIAAGGIIICDKQEIRGVVKEGIWAIVEKSRKGGNGYELTDIGGKYDWNDGDIYATIAREFQEELYHTTEIKYEEIRSLCMKNNERKEATNFNEIYIMRRGKYMCLIVNRNLLSPIKLSPELVENKRKTVLSTNRFCIHRHHDPKTNMACREEMYRTLSLKFLPFDEVAENKYVLSYRLATILKGSFLRFKIPNCEEL